MVNTYYQVPYRVCDLDILLKVMSTTGIYLLAIEIVNSARTNSVQTELVLAELNSATLQRSKVNNDVIKIIIMGFIWINLT